MLVDNETECLFSYEPYQASDKVTNRGDSDRVAGAER